MKGKFASVVKTGSKWEVHYPAPDVFEFLLDSTFDGRKLLVTRSVSGHVTNEVLTVSSFTRSWVWSGLKHMLSDSSMVSIYPDLSSLVVYDLDDKGHVHITAISRRPSVVTESESNTNG